MPTKQSPVSTFCRVELATTDPIAARNFYTSLFGWTVEDFPLAPNELMPGIAPHWLLYIATENADDTAERAVLAGGKVVACPFDLFTAARVAVLEDPTGAIFGLWEPKSRIDMGITGVPGAYCWADLSTRDGDRASQFYSDVFGWQTVPGEGQTSGYLHIKNGDQFIAGIPPLRHWNGSIPTHWVAHFLVSDCDTTAAKTTEMGGRVLVPTASMKYVGRWAVLADPQGAIFAVYEPERRA